MVSALHHLLEARPVAGETTGAGADDLEAFLERLSGCPFEAPLDRALWAGFHADRLGFAFVGGYDAALRELVRPLGLPYRRRCLAATETGGGHPKAIATKVVEREGGRLVLRGEKTFATLASVAEEMLVIASRGETPEGSKKFVLVRVRPDAAGVTVADRAPTEFAPEVPHAKVGFHDVVLSRSDLLPGDGWLRYVKPFRTLEDTHVLAAVMSHLVGAARGYGFDPSVAEGAFAIALGLAQVAALDAMDPAAHVALAGLFVTTRRLIAETMSAWERAPADVRTRWQRDLPLLLLAENVRQTRTAAAWTTLRGSSSA